MTCKKMLVAIRRVWGVASMPVARVFGGGWGGVVAAARGVFSAARTWFAPRPARSAWFAPLALALLALAMPMTAAGQAQTGDGGVSNAMLAERLVLMDDFTRREFDSTRREFDSTRREIGSVRNELTAGLESLRRESDARFDALETKIDTVDSKLTWHGWVVGLVAALLAASIALAVPGFFFLLRQNAETRKQISDMQQRSDAKFDAMQKQIDAMQRQSDAKFAAMQRQIDAMLRQLLPQAEVSDIQSAQRQVEPRGAVDAADGADTADTAPAQARA